jgi:hypothetical protein
MPCFWADTKGRTYNKQGAQNHDSAVVYIQLSEEKPEKGDLMYKGKTSVTDRKTLLGTGALSVISVDINDFGSENHQHYKAVLK